MAKQATKNKAVMIRLDSNRIRLSTGESQRSNGTYAYRWTGSDGKRKMIYAPTLALLREQEKEIAKNQLDNVRDDVKTITVNQIFERWNELKRGIKDNTRKNYIYLYNLFVRDSFGEKRIANIRKSDVCDFYNHLMDEKGLKLASVDGVHNILHQVLQLAVEDNMIRNNPTENILKTMKKVRGDDARHRESLTLAEEKLFFDYLLNEPRYTHWYPIFYIMANTGMRVGEITGLRWTDIDLKNQQIHINHTLVYYDHADQGGCCYSINTPKTKNSVRVIPMTTGVKEAFLMEKEYQKQAGLKSIERIQGYGNFIFINRFGKVQGQSTLNKALHRIMRDCNLAIMNKHKGKDDPVLLPNFSCHILRYTFTTRCIEAGLGVKTVQSYLGHSDVTTTLQIYASVTEDMKKKEIDSYESYVAKEVEGKKIANS